MSCSSEYPEPPRRGAAPKWSLVASTLVAIATIAPNVDARGSRVVPIDDRPIAPGQQAPPRPPQAARGFDWSGVYVGGHTAFDASDTFRSVFGGVQLGANLRLPSSLFLGVETDVSFPYFAEDGVVASHATAAGIATQKIDLASSVRGRVGYALDRWLLFGTFGTDWSQFRFVEDPGVTDADDTALRWRVGWTAGAGAELRLDSTWSLRGEYLFRHLPGARAELPSGTVFQSSPLDVHSVRLGLNWYFDWPHASGRRVASGWIDPNDWNAHWQITFIEQGYFRFRSPYQGTNSLSGSTQFRNTVSSTAFLGARLWDGGELYFNPEVDQGFGLSQTVGVAGFPNGEAQKASYPVPRLNIDRVMVRQTIGLGGDKAAMEDGPNQLRGKRDVSRITITAGRFTVGDTFGLNAYAADPRTQFLNWNIYGSGSYDWVMDKPGFTWGASVELNQKRWALRGGYFLEPTQPNGNSFDTNVPTHGQYLVEPEIRYSLFSRPGRARFLGWLTRASMGSFSEAVSGNRSSPSYPDIASTRRTRTNWGVVANIEQAVSRDLGFFSRASYSPGLVEITGWTDCDESFSLGAVLSGAAWGRADDKIGWAGVIEGLSSEARAFFAAGGMGIVVGDGRLNYRPERVLETYYSYGLSGWASLTLDYQLVVNPAYNADRGPVSIYAARLHAEL